MSQVTTLLVPAHLPTWQDRQPTMSQVPTLPYLPTYLPGKTGNLPCPKCLHCLTFPPTYLARQAAYHVPSRSISFCLYVWQASIELTPSSLWATPFPPMMCLSSWTIAHVGCLISWLFQVFVDSDLGGAILFTSVKGCYLECFLHTVMPWLNGARNVAE